MKKISKRITKLRSLLQKPTYSLDEALNMILNFQTAKFMESVEAHVSLNIDPKYADQQLRTSLILPNGTGKNLRIAVFTELDNVKNVLDYGATIAGADDLLEEIGSGKLDFDVLITTPQLMPKLAKVGKILGPKSLMPSPKSGTVTQNFKETIREFQKGKIEYRADKTGIVHVNFGKADFSKKSLSENLIGLYESIEKNRPKGVKGKYFKSFHICTTMSPSIQIELSSFNG